jgi:phosphoglycolate phosphatase
MNSTRGRAPGSFAQMARSGSRSCRAATPATPATPATSTKRRIVTFDVDGTLVRSVGSDANKLHKEAFASGLAVLGIDDPRGIDVIEHHGSTDGLILVRTAHYHGLPPEVALEKLPEMQEAMVTYFHNHRERAAVGIEVLPGVESLLSALSELDDVYVGLCTGNLEEIAWMKMEALGLVRFFDEPLFGGFGNMYCSGELDVDKSYLDRAKLIEIAAQRVSASTGQDVGSFLRIHVGDAPHDMNAAIEAGVCALGTLTGIFNEQDLRRRAPSQANVRVGHPPPLRIVDNLSLDGVLDTILSF